MLFKVSAGVVEGILSIDLRSKMPANERTIKSLLKSSN